MKNQKELLPEKFIIHRIEMIEKGTVRISAHNPDFKPPYFPGNERSQEFSFTTPIEHAKAIHVGQDIWTIIDEDSGEIRVEALLENVPA